MTRIRVSPEADRDLDRGADDYARTANVDVALRFLRAVEDTCARLGEPPLSGAPVKILSPRLADLRFCRPTGFESDLVFPIASANQVEILRVLHAAQALAHVSKEEPDEPSSPE